MSERAEGGGRHTDLAILFFGEPKSDKFLPVIQDFSNTELIPKFDQAYDALVMHEKEEMDKLSQAVYDMLAPKPEPAQAP